MNRERGKGPPRWAAWLLARSLPERDRALLVREMADLYERRYREWGGRRARSWYVRQAVSFAVRAGSVRGRDRRWSRAGVREERSTMMDRVRQDVRFALRRLGRSPGFALIAVLTLGIGIGANTAIFSVVRAVLLEPPPYEDPAQVVMVWQKWRGWDETWLSGPEVLDFREGVSSFVGVGAYSTGSGNLTDGDEPERIALAQVSADVFELLGVEMAVGRAFTVEEDVVGEDGVAVLTYGFWQRRFGGDRSVVGQDIRLNGRVRTVVGVLGPGVRLPFDYETDRPAELWVPLTLTPDNAGNRGSHGLYGVARLAPGATVERANEELGAVVRRWVDEGLAHAEAQYAPFAVPVMEHVLRGVRPALYVLLGAVAFVLLIACANVANLLLARSDGRLREVALRTSLGAGRSRILGQLMTESLALAVMGGLVGTAIAWAGVQLVVALDPASIPRLEDVRLDGAVFSFTAAIALATGLLFGIAPALQLARPNLAGVLKEGTRSMTAGRSRHHFRQWLVAAEVALSVMLVIGAGLMVRSFAELRRIDVGFESENILTARLSLPANEYPDQAGIAGFYARLIDRVAELPGVRSVGAARLLPLTSTMGDWSIQVEGRPMQPGDNPHGDWQVVTPGYFRTMGLDLVDGRFLEDGDRGDALPVVVVNETMAAEYWPGESAVGRRFRMGGPDAPWFTIVGVVRDVRQSSVTEEPRTEMYHPHDQFRIAAGFTPAAMTLVIATETDPLSLVAPLRSELRAMDPNVPLADIASMEQVTSRALSEPRFITMLLGVFGIVALTLAAIGIYGVISYGVTQRTHEIGIRMALGADRHRVVRMILRTGAGAVIGGLAVGVIGSIFMTNVMERMLYGVSRLDTATFVVVPTLLLAVAILAGLVPARRAAGVDPLVALRYD